MNEREEERGFYAKMPSFSSTCASLDALCHCSELLHQVWMLCMTKMPTWPRLHIELELSCTRGSAWFRGTVALENT